MVMTVVVVVVVVVMIIIVIAPTRVAGPPSTTVMFLPCFPAKNSRLPSVSIRNTTGIWFEIC
jgi:hypothetical protein